MTVTGISSRPKPPKHRLTCISQSATKPPKKWQTNTLVIAEKPSVAQNIAAALKVSGRKDGYIEGGGYLISWCVGHLVGLAAADAYGEQYAKWNYDTLPILPKEWQYTVATDKGKQFKTLKELMHRADVSEVVNACDAGREGELQNLKRGLRIGQP